ncbi:hypothetical protein [Streptomyces sp. NPDC051576]|uniref:hypothetical protein n=1 Tax=Streptomyces sp. NPDC051576 TaxID=3155803 RepID=UPI0034310716
MTAGWGSRAVRAALFAAVCVLLAALGHVMSSGGDVPSWALLAGAVVTSGTGWCLAGRERGLPFVVTVVVAVQAGLHVAFSFAQSTAGDTTSADMGSMDMGSMNMGSAHMQSMQSMQSMDMGPMDNSMGGSSSVGMLAAHLLAALLCGLWLAHGERAAFRILRAVAGWLAAPLRLLLALPPVPDQPRVRPSRPRSDRAPSLRLLVHAITTRGPPAGTAVA